MTPEYDALTEEAMGYLNTEAFKQYVEMFPAAWREALRRIGEAPKHSNVLELFQRLWEELPDSPDIRIHPAFYRICDYAEEYCFGEDGW